MGKGGGGEKDTGPLLPSTVPVGPRRESLFSQYIYIAFIVASYWVISISTVFINKHLLSAQQDFDGPLFVTWFQCAFTVAVCLFLDILSRRTSKFGLNEFPRLTFDFAIMRKVLPLSIIFVGMIAFNNLCLKHVGVAFYYLARSLTTVTNVIFTFTILRQTVSCRALGTCAVITFGYFLGLDQEGITGQMTLIGVVFGVLSSCCVSLNSIFTKTKLDVVENSAWRLCFYNNINATFLFIPLMFLAGELPNQIFVVQMTQPIFWVYMCIGGFCGVAIGLVTALQIQATSALTHNISGTAKACVQTLLAVYIYQDVKSWQWWTANMTVLVGSGLYARVQQLEMERNYKKGKLPS